MIQFDTPEFGSSLNGLPDPYAQAGFYQGIAFKRLIAWIFDGLVTLVAAFIVSILTLGLGFFIFFGIWAVLAFLYRIATLTSGSSTWGMRLMSMELRKGDGSKFDGSTALLHTAGTYVCFATGIQIFSIIMMLVTSRGQGLPDVLLSTTALNQRARL
ncbi:MAG: RDD family protein [Planktomarina sp.]